CISGIFQKTAESCPASPRDAACTVLRGLAARTLRAETNAAPHLVLQGGRSRLPERFAAEKRCGFAQAPAAGPLHPGAAARCQGANFPAAQYRSPHTQDASVPKASTGPAMIKILAPTPVTQPSALNSMAGLTTELANPVMGTSVPAPALAPSFWYQPAAVAAADRKISEMLVSVP